MTDTDMMIFQNQNDPSGAPSVIGMNYKYLFLKRCSTILLDYSLNFFIFLFIFFPGQIFLVAIYIPISISMPLSSGELGVIMGIDGMNSQH